jgi:hypothetical protein
LACSPAGGTMSHECHMPYAVIRYELQQQLRLLRRRRSYYQLLRLVLTKDESCVLCTAELLHRPRTSQLRYLGLSF